MAKTIRSHPTSHIWVLEPIFGTTFIFSGFGPKMDLRFLRFPTSLRVKRLAPKGKKMRMDHPFILDFCQNLIFYEVFTIIFQLFGYNVRITVKDFNEIRYHFAGYAKVFCFLEDWIKRMTGKRLCDIMDILQINEVFNELLRSLTTFCC